MSNLYVSVDSVMEAISQYAGGFSRPAFRHSIEQKISNSQTIDPISEIDKMIITRRNHRDTTDDKELAKVSDSGIAVLEELRYRLLTKN